MVAMAVERFSAELAGSTVPAERCSFVCDLFAAYRAAKLVDLVNNYANASTGRVVHYFNYLPFFPKPGDGDVEAVLFRFLANVV